MIILKLSKINQLFENRTWSYFRIKPVLIVEKLESGMGQRQVPRLLQIPRSTVQNIHKRFSEYGTVSHAQKSGRFMKMREINRIYVCNVGETHS